MDYHPDDWNDVAVYFIVGIPAIIAALAGFVLAWRDLRSTKSGVTGVLEEVKNDHRSNLRDDIDDLTRSIHEGFKSVHQDIAGLREELRTERVERIEGDRDRDRRRML